MTGPVQSVLVGHTLRSMYRTESSVQTCELNNVKFHKLGEVCIFPMKVHWGGSWGMPCGELGSIWNFFPTLC